MNLTKILFRWFLYFLYLLITVVILIEILFQILPVSDSLKIQAINENNPIMHFKKNMEVNKQVGFNFSHIVTKKINNYGFATDLDFSPKRSLTKSTAIIIGDSYVEAIQVENKDTFHGRLSKSFKNINIYPIGVSGSPLSQYVANMIFAKKEFDPDVYIFVIISNDFDESWFEVKKSNGFHYFNDKGAIELINYNPSFLKNLLRNSAFLRYLFLDLKINAQIKMFLSSRYENKNENSKNLEVNKKLGITAIDFFFKNINKISKDKKIILLLDGDRSSIYENKIQRKQNQNIKIFYDKVIELSKDYQKIYIIDLHKFFLEDWHKKKQKFNFDNDFHWNEYGHKIVSESLQKNNLLNELNLK